MNFTYVFYLLIPIIEHRKAFVLVYQSNFIFLKRGIFGFTNVCPTTFADKLETLPAHDPAVLVDRKEYWLLREEPFDETLSERDE